MIIDLREGDQFTRKEVIRVLSKQNALFSEDRTLSNAVSEIISDVRQNGDSALVKYNEKFDNFKCDKSELLVPSSKIIQAYNNIDENLKEALNLARDRIKSYYEKQIPSDMLYEDNIGVKLGWRWNAIESVGIYVPGGLASYPSSVLMNAIPAQVAGVKNISMVVPAPNGKINDAVLAAAKIAGIDNIYQIGGAQAIAALAFGTDTISKVDKIVGPGNIYVAEAKRQLFGIVGIDMIAGPSEILIISDNDVNPSWVAADLLSQAEHDKMARSILITDDNDFATLVDSAVRKLLNKLEERKEIAQYSWERNGSIVIVSDLEKDAVEISNAIAPEHLEIFAAGRQKIKNIMAGIKNAGAIFVGKYSVEALGDYVAGPSHVLPTSSSARFSSGLSVFDFLTRSSIIDCNEDSFMKLAGANEVIANSEGLHAHALSINIRRNYK